MREIGYKRKKKMHVYRVDMVNDHCRHRDDVVTVASEKIPTIGLVKYCYVYMAKR